MRQLILTSRLINVLLNQLCPSLVLAPQTLFYTYSLFPSTSYYENLKYTKKLKKFYGEYLSHHLDSSMNILPYLLYHMSVHLFILQSSAHLIF